MRFADLTIVIPIKNPPNLDLFIKENKALLRSEARKIVIDSDGGNQFQNARSLGFLPLLYEGRDVPLWEARKIGYEYTVTPFILNLDCDVVLPLEYVDNALLLLREGKADAVAIHFDPVKTGHLEFGTSLWKTDILKKLYDYNISLISDGKIVKVGSMAYSTLNNGWCECTYMWRKLKANGYKLETLPMRAKHLR